MPLFHPHSAYLSPEAGLFQLLSHLDQREAQQQKTCVRHQHVPKTFTPRFDVTEVVQAYELIGEVPGLKQEDLSIEFADAQTLVIKGRVERRLPSTSASNTTTNAVHAPSKEAELVDTTESEKSHNPTVEDEYDAADAPLETSSTTPTTPTATAINENAATVTTTENPKTDDAPKPTYWVAERRVGSFERKFSFAQLIEPEAVSASLRNGVLHVVVPKSNRAKKVHIRVN